MREDYISDTTTERDDTCVSFHRYGRRDNNITEADVSQRCCDSDSRAHAKALEDSVFDKTSDLDATSVSSNGDEHHEMCGCDVCTDPAYKEYSEDEIAYFYDQGLRYSEDFGWYRDSDGGYLRDDRPKGVVFLDSDED